MAKTNLQRLLDAAEQRLNARHASVKVAFAPQGSMPPMDPAMAGGAPMDPAAMGGAMPPADPSMMGGGAPMDPAMAGGAPPMDPAAMGGAMPPMDPAAMGGMPADPSMMGGAEPTPPGLQQDPMQVLTDLNDKIDAIGDLIMKVCRHLNVSLAEDENGAESLVNDEELDKLGDLKAEDESIDEPLSDQAQEAVGGGDFIKKQLEGLGGGY